MKIGVKNNDLRDSLKKVISAVDRGGNVPVLSNVLIDASGEFISFTTTNFEVAMKVSCRGKVEEPGRITVNAAKLYRISSSLSADDVSMEIEDNHLVVSSGLSRFVLSTIPADQFPDVEFVDEFSISLQSADLDRAIKKVIYAAGKDEYRYVLTGVYFTSLGDRIHVVATDGHRLAVYEIGISTPEFGVIVPRKAFGEIKKLLGMSEEVLMTVRENRVMFKIGDTYISSSTIEGEYPDYLAVIPEDNPLKCKVDGEELLRALKEVSVVFDKESVKPVVFELYSNRFVLKSRSESAEEAYVQIPSECNIEDVFKIAFNIQHFIDAISTMEKGDLIIHFDSPTTQILIESDSDPGLKCVIMPMRMQDV